MYTSFVPVDTQGGLPYFSRYQLYLYREDGLAKQGTDVLLHCTTLLKCCDMEQRCEGQQLHI